MYMSLVKVDAAKVSSAKLEAIYRTTTQGEKIQKPKREEDFS